MAEIVCTLVARVSDSKNDHSAFCGSFLLFFIPSVPPHHFLRNLEHLRVISRIVNAAVWCRVRELLGQNIVPKAQDVAGNAQGVTTDVEDSLEKPQVLHSRVPASRTDGTFVGYPL